MVRITEELIRKRSEHNEGEISTLEEIALHQEDIEKIEHIQNWCRDLQILLLQSNIIAKIENVSKLKKLQYLNLALNNIEKIENLEGCESLNKLDLTLNFVGELTSVNNLKSNIHLRVLYLTGNPCTDYEGYREYVVTTLNQLTSLDGKDIERSEKILAAQKFDSAKKSILRDQRKYLAKRELQKQSKNNLLKYESEDSSEEEPNEDKIKEFWSEVSDNSPETRVQLALKSRRKEKKKDTERKNIERPAVLFNKHGRPLNVNEAKVQYSLTEEDGAYILKVPVFRYLDTALLDVDLQPQYVRVTIKGKVLQLVFLNEIKTDSSTAQRSEATGHLVITMPQVNECVVKKQKTNEKSKKESLGKPVPEQTKRELLEIGRRDDYMDYTKIVDHNSSKIPDIMDKTYSHIKIQEKLPSPNFIENPEVPPLE